MPDRLDDADEVLEYEGDADRGDEGHEPVRGAAPPERPIRQALHPRGREPRAHASEEQRDQEQQVPVGDHGGECPKYFDADHAPDHEDFGVGEIDELKHSVDHGVPEGDHRVHKTEHQPFEEDLGQEK